VPDNARRLAATDAQFFWRSAVVPNDQFQLYVFAGVPARLDVVLADLVHRAALCEDLLMSIVDDDRRRYPRWVRGAVDPGQFILHGERDWDGCLADVAALVDDQLDPAVASWRLHVFAPVHGAPGASSAVTVTVLQATHSLADGTRATQLAGWLFGREVPVPPVPSPRRASPVVRGVVAARTHRLMMRDIEAGRLLPPYEPQPLLPTNARPAGRRQVRTLLRHRSELSQGPTVTVAVTVAIAAALDGYLRDRGTEPPRLSAEVLLAKPGIRLAQNHFRTIGIGLHPELEPAARATAISADVRAGRARAEHPATLAADRAFAVTPAPVLRWGMTKFDPTERAPRVAGATVVSSVNRGGADLRFGGAPVLWTSGYPALSPMMGLTHGVHGIGDRIAISVHGAESAVDIDDYVARLDRALRP
jgi:hypothetical protein